MLQMEPIYPAPPPQLEPQNEAMNSILWQKCPNSVFCGKQKLTAGAAQSVIQWNQGAAGSATVLYACGVRKYGINTLRGIRIENSTRIVQSSIKCKNRYNKSRQILRQERKSKPADKQNYLFGAFSLESETNKKITKKSKKHLESIGFEITNDVGVTFIDEEVVSMKNF